ncbi:hypothetical protein ACIBJF_50300 [Streptomyces sp. NPDC050743]|uniref:hypothetical protein n=1 Tax=Streptomyces sp. NPDC050743 TaxID=3365634 RepID=UPI0037B7BE78
MVEESKDAILARSHHIARTHLAILDEWIAGRALRPFNPGAAQARSAFTTGRLDGRAHRVSREFGW